MANAGTLLSLFVSVQTFPGKEGFTLKKRIIAVVGLPVMRSLRYNGILALRNLRPVAAGIAAPSTLRSFSCRSSVDAPEVGAAPHPASPSAPPLQSRTLPRSRRTSPPIQGTGAFG